MTNFDWKANDYSQQPKLLKLEKPILMFFMHLDSNRFQVPGLNRGRLYLYDYDYGMVYRWVTTTSHVNKQGVAAWDKRGGVHPPNYAMRGADWFHLKNKRIIQPGQPVDDGFILYYKGSNNWETLTGGKRSQIMLHEDKELNGTAGCFGMSAIEYKSFCTVMEHSCKKNAMIPYGVNYAW